MTGLQHAKKHTPKGFSFVRALPHGLIPLKTRHDRPVQDLRTGEIIGVYQKQNGKGREWP